MSCVFRDAHTLVEIVDAIGLLLFGLDADGRIMAASQHCEVFTGIPRAELVGRSWCDLFADDARRCHIEAIWRQVADGTASTHYESLYRNGRRLRWTFTRLATPDGARLCAVGQDVTDEHDGRARVRSVDRISALANLSAGFAHELRNPLNSASLQIALLARKLAKLAGGDALGEHAIEATREIGRAAALLDDFIAYARPQPLQVKAVRVAEVVQGAVDRAASRASEAGVAIDLNSGPDIIVEVDAERVEGALYNLITNAIEATTGGTAPAVVARWVAHVNSVAIEVEDNGPGLAMPNAPIFDPFFTTKPDGTGLGLAIVERVAIDHGGAVDVRRVDGHTVFRIRLPILHGSIAVSR